MQEQSGFADAVLALETFDRADAAIRLARQ